MADHPHVEFTTRAALRAWLEAHHESGEAIWLVTYKKGARPDLHLPWTDLVQEGLCFGWIDSQRVAVDEERTKLRFSPRKAGSIWSAINKAHAAELEAQGLMAPAGRAAIERAKADGSWSFMDEVEAGIVPEDLDAAFAAHPGSRAQFDGFPWSARRNTLAWIKLAKTAGTRAKRIAEAAAKCAKGERPR
ncbi:MAG: hypothetical protein EP330_27715 [Deltaproteobacteria bacterium]|nr:MAG: hypothetical protein EP330_27715 [Deltaproteobacteria bacterium]